MVSLPDARLSTPSRHTRRSKAVLKIDLNERNEAHQRRGNGPPTERSFNDFVGPE